MLSFKPAFSLFSFTFIKRRFSSASLFAVRVLSSAYLGYWYFSRQSWFQLVLHSAQHFTWCRCGASVQRRNLAEFNLPPFKRQPHQNKKMLNAWKNVCAVRGKRVVHWMLKSNLIMWNLDKPFSACRVQFSSVAQSGSALCNPMDYSTPGLAVHHQLLEFTQTHAHWVGGAIQPFCLPKDPDSPALPQWL